jgi:hypothetical protein
MLLKKLFIHIPKNAGMTIRRSPMLQSKIMIAGSNIHKSAEYSQAVLDKMNSLGDHHGFEHARWRDIHPSVLDRNHAFAVIRNPWDRVVSRYFFARKVIEVEKKVDKRYADVSSFEAFLEERHKWGSENFMWHRAVRGWYPAFDHVTDVDGNIRCDVIRFEHLNDDLCKYFNLVEMSKARNVTALNNGSYRDIYTPETIQIVADWYKKDIDTWGYDFDTGPTRNYWNVERTI